MNYSPTSFRHYGKWQREEIIVLGYNSKMNDVIIARVTGLPVDDQVHLRQIASSQNAQQQNYLFPVLLSERHASGKDWCTYLLNRLASNDKSVMRIPFKDITDMNPEQKAFFGGWGAPVQPEVPTPVLGSPEANTAAAEAAAKAMVDLPEGMIPVAAPVAPDALAGVADALKTLAESQASMAASLEKLTAKVKTPRKAPARKKAATRRKPAAAPAPVVEETAPETVGAE